MGKNRVAFFDCARALCMLYIIGLWHLQSYILHWKIDLNEPLFDGITRGTLAAFAFISAYFLGKRPVRSWQDALDFYKRRLLRFYPMYFIACTSFLLIYMITGVEYIESVKQYVLTLFGLSTVFTPAPATVWFISMLILFYLITPLINALKKIWQKAACCAAMFGLLAALRMAGVRVDARLALYLPVYSLGLIVASRMDLTEKPNLPALVVALGIFAGSALLYGETKYFALQYLVMLSFIVLVLEIGKLLTGCAVSDRVFGFISYGSMVAYLFHRQFFGIWLMFMGKFPAWLGYLVLMPLLLVMSWGVQRIYDRMINKMLR